MWNAIKENVSTFFEKLWHLQTEKWALYAEYWYIWVAAVLIMAGLVYVVTNKK